MGHTAVNIVNYVCLHKRKVDQQFTPTVSDGHTREIYPRNISHEYIRGIYPGIYLRNISEECIRGIYLWNISEKYDLGIYPWNISGVDLSGVPWHFTAYICPHVTCV